MVTALVISLRVSFITYLIYFVYAVFCLIRSKARREVDAPVGTLNSIIFLSINMVGVVCAKKFIAGNMLTGLLFILIIIYVIHIYLLDGFLDFIESEDAENVYILPCVVSMIPTITHTTLGAICFFVTWWTLPIAIIFSLLLIAALFVGEFSFLDFLKR